MSRYNGPQPGTKGNAGGKTPEGFDRHSTNKGVRRQDQALKRSEAQYRNSKTLHERTRSHRRHTCSCKNKEQFDAEHPAEAEQVIDEPEMKSQPKRKRTKK